MRLALLAAAVLAVSSCSLLPKRSPDACSVAWYGQIDSSFLDKARVDLKSAQESCSRLVVDLSSPGGGVFESLEVVRAVEKAEAEGLVVEIHGGALVASGATFVLASGSPGFRYIRSNSLTLVHGIQTQFGCVGKVDDPKNDSERALNRLIDVLIAEYARLSGHPVSEVANWVRCDRTQVGGGELLVRLGLADHTEV